LTTRATANAERWFRPLFLVLIAASLVPIWAVHHHPLGDLAEHLAAGSVLHNYANPQYDFARYYQLSLRPEPYWGYYGPLHLLAYPFGVELANRLVLSLYAVGLPIGMLLLALRFGRSPYLALFSFPMIWNFNFAVGFLPFCMGLAALPFAIVLFDRHCERPSWARGAIAAAAAIVLFFCHLLPWVMFLGAAGAIGLLHQGRWWRRLAGRFAVFLPALVTGIFVSLHSRKMQLAGAQHLELSFVPLKQSLLELYNWVWNAYTGREEDVLVLVLAGAWLALVATARRGRPGLHELRVEACCVIALIAYFALPRAIVEPRYWWGLNVRFAAMACLFAGLCVRGPIEGRRRFLLAPIAAVAIGFAVITTIHWRRAEAFAAGFDELAARAGRHQRVLFSIGRPWRDPSARHDYAQLYSGFYQARYGGYLPWNFDEGFPLIYKERFPAPFWNLMDFDWDRHARYYDYVMAFQTVPNFLGHHHEVTLVGAVGNWTLWKLPGPRVDVPPGPAYPSDWSFNPGWRPPPR
jgi:hypothetical protein